MNEQEKMRAEIAAILALLLALVHSLEPTKRKSFEQAIQSVMDGAISESRTIPDEAAMKQFAETFAETLKQFLR